MKTFKIATIVRNKELYFHIIFWIFYFATIHVNWSDNWFDRSLRTQTVSQFAILLFPFFFYVNAFYLIPKYLKKRKWLMYIIVTTTAIIFLEFTRVLLHLGNSGFKLSFYTAFVQELNSEDNIVTGRLNPIVLCLQFSFAYRFTRDWVLNNTLIDKLKLEKTEMELSFLKSQVNPHFLFNNLNALDSLIETDPKRAKTYLHKLSNIYRYLLTTAEKDVVSLKEELDFINDYTYLLKERYGDAYKFKKTKKVPDLKNFLIPPATLQNLVENAVKHNHGNSNNPLIITINVEATHISVNHRKNLKTTINTSLGKGLKNLKSRYKLLSSKEVKIIDEDTFEVILPQIRHTV